MAGYGRFMHATNAEGQPCDRVQDDVFSPGEFGPEAGGEYNPYQITRYATGSPGRSSRIYFTMST